MLMQVYVWLVVCMATELVVCMGLYMLFMLMQVYVWLVVCMATELVVCMATELVVCMTTELVVCMGLYNNMVIDPIIQHCDIIDFVGLKVATNYNT